MLQPQYYNLIDALVYFIAATIPIYFILKLRNTNYSSTKHLTHIIILLSFILIQGIYHVAGVVGFGLLSKRYFGTAVNHSIAFICRNISSICINKKENDWTQNMITDAFVSEFNNNSALLHSIGDTTSILTLVPLIIFVWLSIRSKSFKGFQFQYQYLVCFTL